MQKLKAPTMAELYEKARRKTLLGGIIKPTTAELDQMLAERLKQNESEHQNKGTAQSGHEF
ncbi:hypothetical protein ACFP1L_13625 [Lactiplantibacillus nangangensis]|uniref:Uncharacterized protein n=1 Tax=Lactiplantibacillus nangangensis TaxID=2559917 RepID=A0ABW1SMP9_9LACO|nr:hypothetical protein [Lactiplantibacillus nangangensis]